MNRFAPKSLFRLTFLRLPAWLTTVSPETAQEAARIRTVECNLGLPVRAAVLLLLSYYFFYSPWFADAALFREGVLEVVQLFLVIYMVLSVAGGIMIAGMDSLPFRLVREVVLCLCLVDAIFVGALAVVTGGFDSILFWIFVGLVLRNALSVPETSRQIFLNLAVTGCYLAAGFTELFATEMEVQILDPQTMDALYPSGQDNSPTDPAIWRTFLLLVLSACCYGVEVLFDRQRRVEEEAREFTQRQQQLESAGRLAAEIAHQLKNPLSVINNAAFTLQRTVKEGKTITQQIQIIREEVERSDRIITKLMGYARLVEGKLEKLDVVEELERAIQQVFPPAVHSDATIVRDYTPVLPPLLAQRGHIAEVFVNLLQNAREAMTGPGAITLTTRVGEDYTILVSIADDGPGIPPDKLAQVFEPYFTTKEKGTGLGLAIVKHNTEIYGGTVCLESPPGHGAKFTLAFPAKSSMRLRR